MTRERLIELILDELLLMGSDADRLTGVAAAFNQLNRTDLRALQALRGGGMTAGGLAKSLHVTSGATTRVIDSLVASGHVVRVPDTKDRRRVLVQLTPAAVRSVDRTFDDLRSDARKLLATYDVEKLETVARFLADFRRLVLEHSRRLSNRSDA